ncbi:LysR family transcriptional regulator [Hymenobacter terrenus]|uniref:LysR family transcriptional regulator n=1 Tax=Hymenobacter terrenus TaxID=1629124 RepID=UPI0006964790|nr:LysR family transcriptional regulator [Hymenobacter terrenus]
MVSSQQLQLVAYIVEEGSLTRAAARLHLTQSALSHQLRDLEAALGLKLFERRNRQLVPTEAGRTLVRSAERVLPELQRLDADIQALRQGLTRNLRLSTQCYTCYHWLPAIIHQFRQTHPQVRVHIVAEATRQPLAWLQAGRIDLAIVTQTPGVAPSTLHPLFEDDLVALLAPGHPLAQHPRPLTPADLAGEEYIGYDVPDAESWALRDFFGAAQVRPRHVSRVQRTEAIMEMVKAALGFTILARWAAAPYVRSGQLVALPLACAEARRQWQAVYLGSEDDVVTAFVAAIRAQVLAG